MALRPRLSPGLPFSNAMQFYNIQYTANLPKRGLNSVPIKTVCWELIFPRDEKISLVEYGILCKVIPTPGHSLGSISVLLDGVEVFAGPDDERAPHALQSRHANIGDDIKVLKKSLRKLLDMGAKTVCPAHGKRIPAEIMRKVL